MINPRYVAWALKHGRGATEQLAADKEEWPGGCMCGYSLWIQEQARAFEATPEARGWPASCTPNEFTSFLFKSALGYDDK